VLRAHPLAKVRGRPTYFKKVLLWKSNKSRHFSFSCRVIWFFSFDILSDERVERERSGAKSEDDDNRKEEQKCVGCNEFVWITEDRTYPIDICGEIGDSKKKAQRNGDQSGG